MRVLVFGDSIAQGFWDSKGGWVNSIRKEYDELKTSGIEGDPPVVFNMGISGDTTEGVLRRFRSETKARTFPGESYAFVFATGTNDAVFRGKENESEPEVYAKQLAELLKQAREFSDRILFVGLLPVVEKFVQPFPWSSTGKCLSNERLQLFDGALKSFCQQNDVPFVDTYSEFAKIDDLESLMLDGLHPNDKGHKLIADLVKPELDKLLK